MSRKLLVIDDDEVGCRLISAIFSPLGYHVIAAHDGPSGLAHLAAERPEIVILDLRLPGMPGLEALERIKMTDPALPVIVLTAHGEVRSAVHATRLGAFDYRTKPIDHDEIVNIVRRATETYTLRKEVDQLRRQLGDRGALSAQMGPSPETQGVLQQVRLVAGSDFSALILGETGTGKELVARAIHRESARRDKPFHAVDCGAIPETLLESELFGHEKGAFTGAEKKQGLFQVAEGGTFFLDEVGNLPISLQAKLLRVLESREVQAVGATRSRPMDIRFVAATNHDLQRRVLDGEFRADLYFRLAQYTIALPALRDRSSDIPYLAQRFLEEVSVELRRPVAEFAADALDQLVRHGWPGNVRELRNVVRQAVLISKDVVLRPEVIAGVLGAPIRPQAAQGAIDGRSLREIAADAARAAESQAIIEALRRTRGNKSQAARALKTDFKTLHLKMKDLRICARDFAS
jgi:two-component system, NtrC family, response regulator HydG